MDGLERSVVQEIKDWSTHALEQTNPSFNDLPACPYAEKAWKEDRVAFSFLYEESSQALTTLLSTFDGSKDVVILVDFSFEEDTEAFHQSLERVNWAISEGCYIQKDLWVMGFHPFEDPNELIDDNTFSPAVNEPYAMIFIQKLSELQEASDKLREAGYYEAYSQDYGISSMRRKRQKTHMRLENGNR